MDDIVDALDAAPDLHQAGAHDDCPVSLQHLGPDDDITDSEFILQGDEDNTLG